MSNPASYPSRSASGDRSSASPGARSGSGSRTVSATGTRGAQGGARPGGNSGGGGHPGAGSGGSRDGGGHSRGGRHRGGHRGWYCPPSYYYYGGAWDWWWGWGSGWGWGWGGGWGGGVYVITESTPAGNQYARVDTDVNPEAAEVYLDGTYIGRVDDFDGFPDYLYLETGKYRLELRHPSYETVVKELDVRAGQAIAVKDDLKLLPGVKKLQAVDPKYKGTPLGRVFGKPGANAEGSDESRTGRFEVQGGQDTGIEGEPVEIDLDDPDEDARPSADSESWRARGSRRGDVAPSSQGRFRFEIEPDDAAVYLDDRYVGTAEELAGLSRGLRVNPGKHVVTVVRPGYETKTVDVEAKPGAAVDVVVELEK